MCHGQDALGSSGEYIFVSFEMLRMRQWARIVRGCNDSRDLRSNGENFVAFDFPLEVLSDEIFDNRSKFRRIFGFLAGSLVMIRLLLFQAVIQRISNPPPGRVGHIRGAVPLGKEDFRLALRLELFPLPLVPWAMGQCGERGGESHHEPPSKRVPGIFLHRLVSLHKGIIYLTSHDAAGFRPA